MGFLVPMDADMGFLVWMGVPALDRQSNRTLGPAYLTGEFFKYLQSNPVTCDVVFPTTFFYPLTANEPKLGDQVCKQYIQPETAAIHYYEGSWR